MNEHTYNALWNFTKERRNYRSDNPGETIPVAILNLYQQEAAVPLSLCTSIDVEEALQCIRNALKYAF